MKKIFCIVLVLQLGIILAQERTVNQDATFEVNPDVWIETNAKYGDIHIESWDNSQVEVHVEITVKGRAMDDVNMMLHKVKVDIAGSNDRVSVTSNLDDVVSQWNSMSNSRGSRVRVKFNDGNKANLEDFLIKYTLTVPRTSNLQIYDKYGDVFIGNVSGKADIWIKYGSLQANELSGYVSLDMGYSKGTIEQLGYADLNVKYSTLNVDRVSTLRLESKYSTFDVGTADTLLSESKYNTLRVESVGFLGLVERHTDFRLNELSDLGKVNMEYGNFKLDLLSPEFSILAIEGEYTDISIGVDRTASYDLELSTRYGDLSYPSKVAIRQKIKDNASEKIMGSVGNASRSKINIVTRYGDVVIRDK